MVCPTSSAIQMITMAAMAMGHTSRPRTQRTMATMIIAISTPPATIAPIQNPIAAVAPEQALVAVLQSACFATAASSENSRPSAPSRPTTITTANAMRSTSFCLGVSGVGAGFGAGSSVMQTLFHIADAVPHSIRIARAAMSPARASVPGMSTLRILHLSDTHLLGDAAARHNGIDTTAALERVLARAAEVEGIGLVVASGDLAEDGSVAAYEKLHERIETFAAARGAATAYAMGNHDLPGGFEQVLGARDGVLEVGGFRVIRLDTSVPGAGYGELFPEQFAWLAEQLATPAAHGSIVVMHHAPVPAWSALLHALELQGADAVLSALGAGDVRLVLSGHYHHSVATRAGGIPVVVAPGVTNTTDALAPAGRERAAAGSGFAVTDLPEAGEPATTFVHVPAPGDGEWLYEMDEELVAKIAAEAGPRA